MYKIWNKAEQTGWGHIWNSREKTLINGFMAFIEQF
jgi:hypothetical protein